MKIDIHNKEFHFDSLWRELIRKWPNVIATKNTDYNFRTLLTAEAS